MNTIQYGRVNTRKFAFIFLAINVASTGADNPPPAPATPAPAPGGSNPPGSNCQPTAPSPTNKDTVKVQLFFEAGVPDNLVYVATVLAFRAKLTDPNVLDLSFMVGAGSKMDENGENIQCPTEDAEKYDCTADKLLVCVLDLAPPETKLELMNCVAGKTNPTSCALQFYQLKLEDALLCVAQNGEKLLKATIEACKKFQPPINDYPSAVFDGVYDNCIAEKAYDDFASVFCAMLNPGKGEGVCPGQQGSPSGQPIVQPTGQPPGP